MGFKSRAPVNQACCSRLPATTVDLELELEQLPGHIEALEVEQQQLQTAVTATDFYKRPAAEIHEALGRLEELETLLLAAYTRWDALDSRTPIAPK